MKMIGICGDNCTYCPRNVATQIGSKIALENVKELWIRLGLRKSDFAVDDMICHGCRPENKCAYVELCACVAKKGYDNCGYCEEYPCRLLNTVFNKSEELKLKAQEACSQEELESLNKAFFSKKEYFDRIRQKRRNGSKVIR